MAKQQTTTLGTVIIYGNPNYRHDPDKGAWLPEHDGDKTPTVEILDVQDIDKDYIKTSKYVLPVSDATVCTSADGLVYSYNCGLPYLEETAHLAEVEKNMIVTQAFLYAGRTTPAGKPNFLMIALVGILGLLAIIGMFK